MRKIYDDLKNDDHLKGKPYSYSVSFGAVAVFLNPWFHDIMAAWVSSR